ncbi:hypothetical protein LCGC14_0704650 [marine sediment metagenome]|uniref:UvrD-like helicase C-terminal domain-containing protein n=1 Tax=marine sediment metagenome TaxID=412755 RepID=A0A0F9TPI1_9ZZZZ|nr:hypothetical protein [archaeon]
MATLSYTEKRSLLKLEKFNFSDIFIENGSTSVNDDSLPIIPRDGNEVDLIWFEIQERKRFNNTLNAISNTNFSNLQIQEFNDEVLNEGNFILEISNINDPSHGKDLIKAALGIFDRSQRMENDEQNIISGEVERTFTELPGTPIRTGEIRAQIIGDENIFTNLSSIEDISDFVGEFDTSFDETYEGGDSGRNFAVEFAASLISTIADTEDVFATNVLSGESRDCFLKAVYPYFKSNNEDQSIISYENLKSKYSYGIYNKKQIQEIANLGNINIVILDKISNYDSKNAVWLKIICKRKRMKTVIINISDFHATLYSDIEIPRFNKQEIKTVKLYELLELYKNNLHQIPLIKRDGIMFALISKDYIYKTYDNPDHPDAITLNSIYFKECKEYGKIKQSKYSKIWQQACTTNGFITNIKQPDPEIELYKFDENKSYQSAYLRINESVGFPNGNDECYKFDNTPEHQQKALKLIHKYNGCSYIKIIEQPDLLMKVFYKSDNIYVNEEIKFAIEYCNTMMYSLKFIIKNVLINKKCIYDIIPSSFLEPDNSLIFNAMIGKCNPQNYPSQIATRDPNEFLHLLYSLRRNSNYKILGTQINKNRIKKQNVDEIVNQIDILRQGYKSDYKKHIDKMNEISQQIDDKINSNSIDKEYMDLHSKLINMRRNVPDEININPLKIFIKIHLLKVKINKKTKLTDLLKIYFQSKEEYKFKAPHIAAQIYAFQKIKMIKLANSLGDKIYAIRVDSITIPKTITEEYIKTLITDFKVESGINKYKIEKCEHLNNHLYSYKQYPMSKLLIAKLDQFKYTETDICNFSPLTHWHGPGGSGKSFDARKLNLDNIVFLSPTHQANKQLEGCSSDGIKRTVMTIHKFFGIKCRAYCEKQAFSWIFIDEIGMCTDKMAQLAYDYHIKTGCYFIISGDFAQLLPSGKLGIPFRTHPFYKLFKVVNYHNDYRRDKDQTEFSEMLSKMRNIILENLEVGKKQPLSLELIEYFNKRWNPNIYKYVNKIIAGTNSMRKNYNKQKLAQKLNVIPIICTKTSRKMLNGDEGTYTRSTKKAKIENIEWNQKSYVLLPFDIKVNYSCTIHSAQGKTYNFKYLIHNKSVWSLSQLYVALSRAKRIDDVYITHFL